MADNFVVRFFSAACRPCSPPGFFQLKFVCLEAKVRKLWASSNGTWYICLYRSPFHLWVCKDCVPFLLIVVLGLSLSFQHIMNCKSGVRCHELH